ncbi:MAG: hypothetical protein IPP60_03685 [Sphingobacteriales bacterium]|nr:hypothetical protein [Sphingobacteriales bacterium]
MINKIILYILFVIPINCIADSLPDFKDETLSFFKTKFALQTFQINQFIDRFNFDEPIYYNKVPPSRKFNLTLLVNRKDTSLVNSKNLIEFINKVSEDTIHNLLSFTNDNLIAIINCDFIYREKVMPVQLKLKLNGNDFDGYSWRIIDVSSKLFEVKKDNKRNYINPMNNEIGFSELSKLFNSGDDIANVFKKDFLYDSMSSFRDYIKNKELVFKQIKLTQYHFSNVAGYSFNVDYFMRMDMNAGWLISDVSKD